MNEWYMMDFEDAVVKEVAENISELSELDNWMGDLYSHGCVSGMVSGLIYNKDIWEWFDKHMDAIDDVLDLPVLLGEVGNMHDLIQLFVWRGFEIKAIEMWEDGTLRTKVAEILGVSEDEDEEEE